MAQLSDDAVFSILDVDRHISDNYDFHIAIQEKEDRISIGAYLMNLKSGLVNYCDYWHFNKNEKNEALKLFEQLKKKCSEFVKDMSSKTVPMSLLYPMFAALIQDIDIKHREKSGVQGYNWSLKFTREGDWRELIYGNRYPNLSNELSMIQQETQSSKQIENSGYGRNKIVKYKFSNTKKVVNSSYNSKLIKTSDGWKSFPFTSERLLNATRNKDAGVESWLRKNKHLSIPVLLSLLGLPAYEWYVNRNIDIEPVIQQYIPDFALPKDSTLDNQQEQNQFINNEQKENVSVEPNVVPEQPAQNVVKPQTSKQPRGIRNNNPGNIERNNIKWKGMSPDQSDSRFVNFSEPEYGIRAIYRILTNYQNKHKLNTIRKMINRWAPPVENDTNVYVNFVAKQTGINADQVIDMSDKDVAAKLIKAIIRFENGESNYDDAMIERGIAKPMPIPPFESKQTELFKSSAYKQQHVIILENAIHILNEQKKPLLWKNVAPILSQLLSVQSFNKQEIMPLLRTMFFRIVND